MTAVPSWHNVSDADLARAAAAGDRRAFAEIYDRYADRLHDFCVGMLADRDAAADCVQDAFCVAATSLANLREPDKLRSWLYGIARNHALRRIDHRRREQVSDELPDIASQEAGPDTIASRTELANLVAEAAGGLSDRDRSVLDLVYRHGLDGPELAQAFGVTLTNANTMMHRLRETVERSLGALLVARRAQRNPNECSELGAILATWDGRFNVLMRKRIARHIESCPTCEEQRRRMVNPAALLGAAPVFIPAPDGLRSRTLDRIQLTSASSSMKRGAGRGRSSPARHGAATTAKSVAADEERPRRLAVIATLLIGVPLLGVGLTVIWLHQSNTPTAPAVISRTTPAPSNLAPTAPPPAAPSNPLPGPSRITVAPAPAAPNRGATPAVTPPPAAPQPVPPPAVTTTTTTPGGIPEPGPTNPAQNTPPPPPQPVNHPGPKVPIETSPPTPEPPH